MNSPNFIQAEELLQVLFQSPNATAVYAGEDVVILTANAAMLSLWGKDRSVIGKSFREAIPALIDQPFFGILQQVWRSGETYFARDKEAKLEVDGQLQSFYFDFEYKAILGDDGCTKYILHTAFEVSQRMKAWKIAEEKSMAEQRLTEELMTINEEYQASNESLAVLNEEYQTTNEELLSTKDQLEKLIYDLSEVNTRLEIALDASKLGSTEVTISTGKMDSTAQFKRNYGYEPDEEFTYADLFASMFPEHHERVRGLVREAMMTNGVYKTEYPIRWRDGSVHWIQAHGRPRYDENGKADRMVGMTMDITEAKLFEQRKDDFLSIASHELKTPITSLKASLQLLERMKNKPYSEMHIRLIEQSAKSMNKLGYMVDELLNMSKLNRDQLNLEKSTFNLHDLMSMCCNHVRLEGKYELMLEGEKELLVHADEHRIDQVIVNFVNNAVKYAPESYQIRLKISSKDNVAKVLVSDSGPGIDGEVLPNLFDRYYRASHSEKSYNGLGLGLYICKEIITKHGGEIGVESVLGQGSTFWFTLPVE
ncbi:multi-sensor hybrid histidine kinase [Pedobacter sp. BAL39]|uniref:PAS domain-containing sensor histidine kinase n=1 Tax=Pedobacter sp. BAL39 TaxID=391596 RepID=UPI00015595E9|nr:ATP-binding protein [Pedobacter sp. BAL39]EDM38009.1 multi-sensor hybrid histidine kinase [Pedobacter sp. BAL39]